MRRAAIADIALPQGVRAALERLLSDLEEVAGGKVERLILFGSAARGEMRAGSDVDILVVWAGSLTEGLDVLVPLTTEILLDTGVDISAHPVPRDAFERIEGMRTAFFENLSEEGVVVA